MKKQELIYLKNVNKKMSARNRGAILNKIAKCLSVLARDKFVKQYIKHDNDARRWCPETNTGVMGTAIELLSPICFYIDEETGSKEQGLAFHWLQWISYDVEKESYEKILKNVSMWAHDILKKFENRDLEVEISEDSTCMEDRWI